jgi:hypothetical protein
VKLITKSLVPFFVLLVGSALFAPSALANYGSNPGDNGHNNDAHPPYCGNKVPGVPAITFVRKSGNNQIEIGWNNASDATSWTVAYGRESGKYTYGVTNFGNSESRLLKIGMLPPGIYYLTIKANNGCMPGEFSHERKMTVTGGGSVLGARTTKGTILGAKVTPTAVPSGTVELSPSGTPSNDGSNGASSQGGNFFQKILRFIFGK